MLLPSTFRGFGFIKKIFSSINQSKSVVTDDCKLVILVPSDVPMSKGKTAVSCSHAAVLCYVEASKKAPKIANQWLSVGQKKVVLKWDRGLPELQKLAKTAAKQNLISVIVRDAGRTQVSCGTVTAVGIGPGSNNEIEKILPNLKLM